MFSLSLLAAISFLSAFLLFLIQPIAGEILTPAAGGASVAWISCLFFFQSVLFLGYGSAWWLTRKYPTKAGFFQGILVFAGAIFLLVFPPPIQPESIFFDQLPVQWGVLGYLSFHFLVPVLALATTSTVTQHCALSAGDRASRLYAWSNAGSFAALLSFPLVVERLTARLTQIQIVTGGMFLYSAIMLIFQVYNYNNYKYIQILIQKSNSFKKNKNENGQFYIWLIIPFITSALMCGVTGHISNEIASVPFIWIFTLSFFLLSFIISFSNRFSIIMKFSRRILPIFLITTFFFLSLNGLELAHGALVIPLLVNLGVFFIVCLLLNDLLHSTRPSPLGLGRFYFFMALGGLAGTGFQALLAPVLFSRVGFAEYPLSLLAAGCILGLLGKEPSLNRNGWFSLGFIGFASAGSIFLLRNLDPMTQNHLVAGSVGVLFVLCYTLGDHLAWFSLGTSLVLLGSWIGLLDSFHITATFRNEYGMIRIATFTEGDSEKVLLLNGGTIHGIQSWAFRDERGRYRPLSYYGENGPAGILFQELKSEGIHLNRVGLIGLGVGSLSWYAQPESDWVYFELDPAMGWAASESGYFSFLKQSETRPSIVYGDGRRKLAESNGQFDMLVLDAFSSDTIPVHLLTKEALTLYLEKLTPTGTLFCHISNRHFDLLPIIAGWQDTCGLKIHYFDDREEDPEASKLVYSPSQWVIITKNPKIRELLESNARWQILPATLIPLIWTDDHHSVFSILKW